MSQWIFWRKTSSDVSENTTAQQIAEQSQVGDVSIVGEVGSRVGDVSVELMRWAAVCAFAACGS